MRKASLHDVLYESRAEIIVSPPAFLDTGRNKKIQLTAKEREKTEMIKKEKKSRVAVSKQGDRSGSDLIHGREQVQLLLFNKSINDCVIM